MTNPQLLLTNQTPYTVNQQLLQQFFSLFCQHEQLPQATSAGVVIVLSPQMQELNKRWRGVNKATDVVSFPAEGVPDYLGEIIVDIQYIEYQAGNMDDDSRLCKIIAHGLLHLTGHDHISTRQAAVMRQREQFYSTLIDQLTAPEVYN